MGTRSDIRTHQVLLMVECIGLSGALYPDPPVFLPEFVRDLVSGSGDWTNCVVQHMHSYRDGTTLQVVARWTDQGVLAVRWEATDGIFYRLSAVSWGDSEEKVLATPDEDMQSWGVLAIGSSVVVRYTPGDVLRWLGIHDPILSPGWLDVPPQGLVDRHNASHDPAAEWREREDGTRYLWTREGGSDA